MVESEGSKIENFSVSEVFEPIESKERLLFIVYVALGVFSIYWVMHVLMVRGMELLAKKA